MTWCVPFRAVAPWAEKCCSLSNLAKSPTDPVVCDGRTTWVRFFTHTKAAVSTEMGVCVCGWVGVWMWMWMGCGVWGVDVCAWVQVWVWVLALVRSVPLDQTGLPNGGTSDVLRAGGQVDRLDGEEALLEVSGGLFDGISGRQGDGPSALEVGLVLEEEHEQPHRQTTCGRCGV